jgi:hypothetical protein
LFLKMCDLIIVGTENGVEVKNCKWYKEINNEYLA